MSFFPHLAISCVLFSCCWSWSKAELFTAISDVEPLLETHKRIIDDLDEYILKEEERLTVLKRHLNIYKREHEIAMEDIPNYSRLSLIPTCDNSNLSIIQNYIKNLTVNHADVKYPTLEDLAGAAQALTRLQETYHLEVSELAEGRLNGVNYSAPMSAGDCYELGKALYSEKDYTNALAWMTEAMRKYKEENQPYLFKEIDIMEYIGFAHYLLGDVKSALEWTKKMLILDPKHVRALGNVPHYNKIISEEEEKLQRRRRGDTGKELDEAATKKPATLTPYAKERKVYEKLCRGEVDIPQEISKTLTCRYLTETHPFLRLAAVKMEYMYRNPDIVVFYDVLSDHEIENIKRMAKPRFKRATVHDPKTGELVPAHYRISKSGWLKDEESPIVARVSRRVAHFTGLSMMSAEELQVVNYGIGGHYEPHFDFARKQETAFGKVNGNRIATVLFYMSSVAQGGATVFTELGLSVFPVRGAALFWLNLHPSGEGDLATRHAACPVLTGSKWVCNKWIHQGGQELIHPCNLEYQPESMRRKIPRPIPKSSR